MSARSPSDGLRVHPSLACFAGRLHEVAAALALGDFANEPAFGRPDPEHAQIVPQCVGHVNERLCVHLRDAHPATTFRLHANVRLGSRMERVDLSHFESRKDWFVEAARLSRILGAGGYTAHAGMRSEASTRAVLRNSFAATDLFGIPVGVEGMYPDPQARWLISSWNEYAEVLESGAFFALDLSHLHILAMQTGTPEIGLCGELLASDRCIEVHVSSNDGTRDEHRPADPSAWWMPLLRGANPAAVIFSEGNARWSTGHPAATAIGKTDPDQPVSQAVH
jgi:hypothetical protein